MAKIKLKYTDESKKKLEEAKEVYLRSIEKHLSGAKFVPGDREIEITASDIENVIENTKIIDFKQRFKKKEFKKLVLYTYFIIGLSFLLLGIFYIPFNNILENNPRQAIFILFGIIISIISAFLISYFNLRENMTSVEEEIKNNEEKGKHQ